MPNLFASILNSPVRWVLAGLALIAVVLAGAQGLDYASTWLAHHRTANVVHATEAAHAARAAAEPAARHHFDSTFFDLAGQHREAVRAGLIPKARYDSLRRLFPAAVPELPAQPARYRPSR